MIKRKPKYNPPSGCKFLSYYASGEKIKNYPYRPEHSEFMKGNDHRYGEGLNPENAKKRLKYYNKHK